MCSKNVPDVCSNCLLPSASPWLLSSAMTLGGPLGQACWALRVTRPCSEGQLGSFGPLGAPGIGGWCCFSRRDCPAGLLLVLVAAWETGKAKCSQAAPGPFMAPIPLLV